MSDFLDSLLSSAAPAAPAILPRVPSRFEELPSPLTPESQGEPPLDEPEMTAPAQEHAPTQVFDRRIDPSADAIPDRHPTDQEPRQVELPRLSLGQALGEAPTFLPHSAGTVSARNGELDPSETRSGVHSLQADHELLRGILASVAALHRGDETPGVELSPARQTPLQVVPGPPGIPANDSAKDADNPLREAVSRPAPAHDIETLRLLESLAKDRRAAADESLAPFSLAPAAPIPPRMEPERLPASRGAPPPSSPTINVTIGRVEVRAVREPTPPKKTERPKSAVMGLDEYLQRRSTGGHR